MKYLNFRTQIKWLVFAIPIGVMAGLSSALFLYGLDFVTKTRQNNEWLIFLLPLAGLFIGYIYFKYGGNSKQGTNLVIDQLHEPTELLPRPMGVLVLFGTWLSHLFGASVGREGTALQISSSLAEIFFTKLKLVTHNDTARKVVLICAKAGGFGAVFGVPIAGAIFALEVQKIHKLKYQIILPVLLSSFLGNFIVRILGYHHFNYPHINFALSDNSNVGFWFKLVLLGLIFGLASNLFSLPIELMKNFLSKKVSYSPLHPFIGGVILIAIFLMIGAKYEGLSMGLIAQSVQGHHVQFSVFALKILVTVIALSFGYIGGEVTPLFVIGSTLGAALVSLNMFSNLNIAFVAALGLVAVFAGASNTPFASAFIGAELFGMSMLLPFLVVCIFAYFVSVEKGIYHAQKRSHKFKLISLFRNISKNGI